MSRQLLTAHNNHGPGSSENLGFVSGHDFSRAVTARIYSRALGSGCFP